jgi:hypothetical protein
MMGLRAISCLVLVVVLASRPSELAAEVVYGSPDGSMTLGGRVDLNGDGISDFYFSAGTGCTDSYPGHCWSWYTIEGFKDPYDRDQGFNGNGILERGVFGASLIQGTVIGPNVPGVNWLDGFGNRFIEGLTFDAGSIINPRPEGPRIGHLGIRFSAEDGLHYGWFRVLLEPWQEPPYQVGEYTFHLQRYPEVLDWAYDSTPNTPIVAGAVPEAGTVMLGAVGGMALIVVWRRRRVHGEKASR